MHSIFRHYEHPVKAPPTYAYMAPSMAIIFIVTRHLVWSLYSPLIKALLASIPYWASLLEDRGWLNHCQR